MINQKPKERRIWYFPCSSCGKTKAQSHKKKKAGTGLCRKCRRNKVPDNQPDLFKPIETPSEPKK